MSGQVYYGEDNVVDDPGTDVDGYFREVATGLIGRLAAKEAPGSSPASQSAASSPSAGSIAPRGRNTTNIALIKSP